MVKVISTILLCVAALFARGQAFTDADSAWKGKLATPVAGAACATSDTTLPHDVFLEGFETPTTGYENSGWSGSDGTVNPATDTSSLTTGKPTGACDQAASIAATATTTFRSRDFGAGVLTFPLDCYFYFYVDAWTDLAFVRIFNVTSSPASMDAGNFNQVQFSRSGTDYRVRGAGINQTAWINVNLGEWNLIKLHIDHSSTTSSYIQVNGGSQETFDSDEGGGERYIQVGMQTFVGTPATGTIYFDTIALENP